MVLVNNAQMPIPNLALRKIELIRIQAFAGSPFKTTNGTVTAISLPSKVSNICQNTQNYHKKTKTNTKTKTKMAL